MVEDTASYLKAFREKLHAMAQLAKKELAQAQEDQKQLYDAQVWPCSFEQGQKVLLLLPSPSNKLLVSWLGPTK